MSKKQAYLIMVVYGVVFILPPLVYLLANFYIYLFDGWELNDKFLNALFWVIITSIGYMVLNPFMLGVDDE